MFGLTRFHWQDLKHLVIVSIALSNDYYKRVGDTVGDGGCGGGATKYLYTYVLQQKQGEAEAASRHSRKLKEAVSWWERKTGGITANQVTEKGNKPHLLLKPAYQNTQRRSSSCGSEQDEC